MKRLIVPTLVAGAATLAGCSQDSSPVAGPKVAVAVAPLSLPGIGYACFDFVVKNAAGQTVTSQGNPSQSQADGDGTTVCSDQYGNGSGGDITYITPCDADGPNGSQSNTVTLWVDGLYTAAGAPIEADGTSNWQNPCGTNGCSLTFDCKENADVQVTFNLTILRDANQGFFDVAVNFEDIFCSAKLDCVDDQGGPLDLLFHPGGGDRDQTAVVALACTAGPGSDVATVLHMNDIVITCDGQDPIILDPAQGPGNVWTVPAGDNPDPVATDAVWQYATYRGEELLPCDGQSCNKLYWNVAIGFDPSATNCHASVTATASSSEEMTDGWTPAASTYPYIAYDVQLTGDGSTADNLVCQSHPLNGGTGVGTAYTAIDKPATFCHNFDGVDVGLATITDANSTATTAREGGQLATISGFDVLLANQAASQECASIKAQNNIDVVSYDTNGQASSVTLTPGSSVINNAAVALTMEQAANIKVTVAVVSGTSTVVLYEDTYLAFFQAGQVNVLVPAGYSKLTITTAIINPNVVPVNSSIVVPYNVASSNNQCLEIIRKLTAEITDENAAFDTAKASHNEKVVYLQSRIQETKALLSRNQRQLQQLQEALSTSQSDLQKSQEELISLQARHAETLAAIVTLKDQLADLNARYELIGKLAAEIGGARNAEAAAPGIGSTCTDAANDYQARVDMAGDEQAKVYEQQQAKDEQQLNELQVLIANNKATISDDNDVVDSLTMEIDRLENQAAMLKNTLEALEMDLASLIEQRAAEQQLCDRQNQQYQEATNQRNQDREIVARVEEILATSIEALPSSSCVQIAAGGGDMPSSPNAGLVMQTISMYQQIQQGAESCINDRVRIEDQAQQSYLVQRETLQSQIEILNVQLRNLVQYREQYQPLYESPTRMQASLDAIAAVQAQQTALGCRDTSTVPSDPATCSQLSAREADLWNEYFAALVDYNAWVALGQTKQAEVTAFFSGAGDTQIRETQRSLAQAEEQLAYLTEQRKVARDAYVQASAIDNDGLNAIQESIALLSRLVNAASAPSLPSGPLTDIAQMLQQIRQDLVQQQAEADMLYMQQDAQCQVAIDDFNRRVEENQTAIADAHGQLADINVQLERIFEKRAKLSDEIENLTMQNKVAEEQVVALQDEIMVVQERLANLRNQLAVIAQRIQDAQAYCESVVADAVAAGTDGYIMFDQTEASWLGFDNARVNEENEAYKKNVEQLKAATADLTDAIAKFQEQIANLEDQIAGSKEESKKLETQLSEELDFYAALTKKHEQLISKLQAELQAAQSSCNQQAALNLEAN